MTEIETPERMDPGIVESYFRLGFPARFKLLEEPDAVMTIDPTRDEVRLETPARGSEPDVTAYEHLALEVVDRADGPWFELRVDASDSRYEAYVLVVSVVDQLRSGASVRHAVSEALAALRDLLKSRKTMTDEKVAGLIGELLVLEHLLETLGEAPALQGWLGPLAEEHDFGLPEYDVEVKTTKSESRVHVIGTEHQLEPAPDRPLYLLSVQITRAGAADDAFSLTELIARIRGRLLSGLRTFDRALESVGWRDADADLYRTRFQVRSVPRAYLVDERFPAITSARLDAVVPQRALISAVSYRIDASSLDHAAVGGPLHTFCEAPR